jgi:hypothetical protein
MDKVAKRKEEEHDLRLKALEERETALAERERELSTRFAVPEPERRPIVPSMDAIPAVRTNS